MKKWHVLVVDDTRTNLAILEEYLSNGPYVCTFAENGAEAWQRMEHPAQDIDLVILDRMMPVMDGMEFLQKLKNDARFAHIPVIMQTAAASTREIQEGLDAGCYYYLTKPYSEEAMMGVVQAAVLELRGRDTLRAATSRIPDLGQLDSAAYSFRTIQECARLSVLLSRSAPSPDAAKEGLWELMLNAIEHGNLGLSYHDKSQLVRSGEWENEIKRRMKLPEYAARVATVQMKTSASEIVYTISDQGAGFDCLPYLDFDVERAFDPNGRGIAVANHACFSRMEYKNGGRTVVARIKLAAMP